MLTSTSTNLKINASFTIHRHHDHHDSIDNIDVVINLQYKSSYAGYIIITQHEKSKSFSFTLSLLLDHYDFVDNDDDGDPQLIVDSNNVFELVWDPAMEELDNLGVEKCLRPRIIDEIASAYLRCTEIRDEGSPFIVLDVEVIQEDSSPNKDVFKGLLIDRGIITLLDQTATASHERGGGPTRCAICLEEAAASGARSPAADEDEEGLLLVGRLRCNHVYHVECLVKWVLNCCTKSKTTPSCPLCRFPLFAAH